MADTVGLRCDRCGAVRATHESDLETLRGKLRKFGWLCVDDTDVCDVCRRKAAG